MPLVFIKSKSRLFFGFRKRAVDFGSTAFCHSHFTCVWVVVIIVNKWKYPPDFLDVFWVQTVKCGQYFYIWLWKSADGVYGRVGEERSPRLDSFQLGMGTTSKKKSYSDKHLNASSLHFIVWDKNLHDHPNRCSDFCFLNNREETGQWQGAQSSKQGVEPETLQDEGFLCSQHLRVHLPIIIIFKSCVINTELFFKDIFFRLQILKVNEEVEIITL